MIATVTLNPSLDEWMERSSLRVGALNRAVGSARYPGGKGINVARVIHELGERTVAFGLAGGEDGRMLRALLNRLAIRHEFVTVRGNTRSNYKIRTTHPLALTEINTAGPAVSAAVLRSIERRLLAHQPRPCGVVLSGMARRGSWPGIILDRSPNFSNFRSTGSIKTRLCLEIGRASCRERVYVLV